MAKENQNKSISDGVNRCRRCDRPLSNPTDNYGWRCAQILGLANYNTIAGNLDSDELLLYNAYVTRYQADDAVNRKKATSNSGIEQYGVGTKVHTALVILNEAYDMFPEYTHAIAELDNEIMWFGNEWGSKYIENRAE